MSPVWRMLAYGATFLLFRDIGIHQDSGGTKKKNKFLLNIEVGDCTFDVVDRDINFYQIYELHKSGMTMTNDIPSHMYTGLLKSPCV